MNTGIIEIWDVKLSVGFVDFAELPVEYELEGVYVMSGGYAEYYNEKLVGYDFAYVGLNPDSTTITLSINDEEVEFELTDELRFEINDKLIDLELDTNRLVS